MPVIWRALATSEPVNRSSFGAPTAMVRDGSWPIERPPVRGSHGFTLGCRRQRSPWTDRRTSSAGSRPYGRTTIQTSRVPSPA
jgi:hypothetical protein